MFLIRMKTVLPYDLESESKHFYFSYLNTQKIMDLNSWTPKSFLYSKGVNVSLPLSV